MELSNLKVVTDPSAPPLEGALSKAKGLLSAFAGDIAGTISDDENLNARLLALSSDMAVLSELAAVARGVAGALAAPKPRRARARSRRR